MNAYIGTLRNGKRFRSNKKRIVAEREGEHNEIEGILHTEENICQISPVEEDPTHIRLLAKPTTPFTSPRTEVVSKVLLIVVGGSRPCVPSPIQICRSVSTITTLSTNSQNA